MIDFVPVEVYAHEGEGVADSTKGNKRAVADGQVAGNDQRGYGAKESTRGDGVQCRQSRVIQPLGLPPLPSKALAFTTFFIHGERDLFGGRHDGVIAHWQIQHQSSFHPPPINTLHGHTGAVLALDVAPGLGRSGLLFSSSADRTIKVWDPWSGSDARGHGSRSARADAKGGLDDAACVQTLIGHDAGVTSLKVLTRQHNGLVSCSLDRSVRTWVQADGRALLLYPLYVPGQVLSLPGESWPTALCVRAGAACSLFVADSAGCISLYSSGTHSASVGEAEDGDGEAWRADSAFVVPRAGAGRQQSRLSREAAPFTLQRRFAHLHALGVLGLQLVADSCFVVSLGFDEKAQVLDAISGALSCTIASPSGARFTSCGWDARGQLLLLGDASGVVHLWSMLDDKVVARKRVVPPPVEDDGDAAATATVTALVAVKVLAPASGAGGFVFTGCASGIKQWLLNRDVGYDDYLGHSQGIVAVVIKDEDELELLVAGSDMERRLGDEETTASDAAVMSSSPAAFFSASLDKTIRCWDADEHKPSFGFEERASEITCMAASAKFRKLFTGHESGAVKAWGVHTGEFVQAAVPSKRAVTCLASGLVRDQELLVTGDAIGALWVWEVHYDRLVGVGALDAAAAPSESRERTGEVTAALFSEAPYLSRSGDEFVVAGYASGAIRVWSMAKKTAMSTIQAHTDLVTSLAMHGCFLFSSSEDLLLRMWNVVDPSEPYELGVLRPPAARGALPRSSSGSGSPIVSLDVVQPEGLVLSAAADGTLLAWDYSAFEDEGAFEAYGKIVFRAKSDERVQCLRYWPAKHAAICGTADGKLLVYTLPQQLRASTDTV